MHYTVDYSELDHIAKHNKAIADIIDYMGRERFDTVTGEFRKFKEEDKPDLDQFGLCVSFAGVSGYPVKAWYNYIWPL